MPPWLCPALCSLPTLLSQTSLRPLTLFGVLGLSQARKQASAPNNSHKAAHPRSICILNRVFEGVKLNVGRCSCSERSIRYFVEYPVIQGGQIGCWRPAPSDSHSIFLQTLPHPAPRLIDRSHLHLGTFLSWVIVRKTLQEDSMSSVTV